AGAAVRGAGPPSACARIAPGDLADAVAAAPPPRAGHPLRGPHPRLGLLPRPARLPEVPLPQHRAPLAVPALPRVEHVRGGEDLAGQGERRGIARSLTLSTPNDTTPTTQNQNAHPKTPTTFNRQRLQTSKVCHESGSLGVAELGVSWKLGIAELSTSEAHT